MASCRDRIHETSDLWDLDDVGAAAADDESDWDSGSDSDTPAAKRKRKTMASRARKAVKRPPPPDLQDLCEPLSQPDEADQLLDKYLAEQQQQQQQAKRQKRVRPGSGRSPSPLLILDEDADADAEQQQQLSPLQPLGGAAEEVLDPRTRAVMARAREMHAMLAEARRVVDEQQEEEQEEEQQPAAPVRGASLLGRRAAPVEDLTLDLLADSDEEGAGQEPGATSQQGEASGGEGKVALAFKTRGHEDVTVRLSPGDQLQRAMDVFRKFAREAGWGGVKKFHSPDGDLLTGDETAEELDLESGDIIEVFLD